MSGAIAEAAPVKPDQIPLARGRSSALKLDWMMARHAGIMSGAGADKRVHPGATAHSTDAAANPTTPVGKTGRRPN